MPSPVTIVLEAGSVFDVPADWNNQDNSVQCIGAGGGGAAGSTGGTGATGEDAFVLATRNAAGGNGASGGAGGGGGGQGASAKKYNIQLTPGTTAPYKIGQVSPGVAGGPTYFNGTSFDTAHVAAVAGAAGSGTSGGAGGDSSLCNGSEVVSGANGANASGGSSGTAGATTGASAINSASDTRWYDGAAGGSGGAAGKGGDGGSGASYADAGTAGAGADGSSSGGGGGAGYQSPALEVPQRDVGVLATPGGHGGAGAAGNGASGYGAGGGGGGGGAGGGGGGGSTTISWTFGGVIPTPAGAGGAGGAGGAASVGSQGAIIIIYTPTSLSEGSSAGEGAAAAVTTATKRSPALAQGIGNVFGISRLFVIYCATKQWASRPTDSPRSEPFRGTMSSYTFQRSIAQGSLGVSTVGSGQLVIANSDGFYDFLPKNYAIDGRDITIRIGREQDSYGSAYTVAKVTSTGWQIDIDSVTIALEDYSYKLKVSAQPNLYGGTGGSDGNADILGKRKPLSFGTPKNVSAVPVDPTNLTYQLHDGSIQSVDAVYDRGAGLTAGSDYATYADLIAATVTEGSFGTCLAEGFIKLGSKPQGTLTADLHGENSSGFLQTTADIVRWFVREKTVLDDPDGLDVAAFDALNTAQPAPIDFFLGPDDQSAVTDVCANLMSGIGGWYTFNRSGLFTVAIFLAPAGSPTMSFVRNDIMNGDVSRQPLPAELSTPQWRWRIPYQLNWTVQSSDLAGEVTADRQAFLAQQYSLAIYEDDAVKTDHPFAIDPDPSQAYFTNQTDALAEATRRSALFKVTRAMYQFSVPRRALKLDLGAVISLTHPRWDLADGRLMTVVEINESAAFSDSQIDNVEILTYG